MDERKLNKKILVLMLIIITLSFSYITILTVPYFFLFGKTDREKELLLGPEEFELLYFVDDLIDKDSGSIIAFLDLSDYQLGHQFFYPNIECKYINYVDDGTDDEILLDFLEIESISHIFIFNTQFSHSSNTTLFLKFELDTSRYLLEVNRSAL